MDDNDIWVHRDFDFRKIQKIEVINVPNAPKQTIIYYGDSEASAEKLRVLGDPQDIGKNMIHALKTGDKYIYLTQVLPGN